MGNALERFWARKEDAREIGATAAKRIRRLVPPDPARVFADKIRELLSAGAQREASLRLLTRGGDLEVLRGLKER
jgi:hypothetical protein